MDWQTQRKAAWAHRGGGVWKTVGTSCLGKVMIFEGSFELCFSVLEVQCLCWGHTTGWVHGCSPRLGACSQRELWNSSFLFLVVQVNC